MTGKASAAWSSAPLTRLKWRLGRRLYMAARGEERYGDIARNGEAMLQRCVADATAGLDRFAAVDIGANQGEWSLSLLAALGPERCVAGRTRVHAIEPVPETARMCRERLASRPGGQVVTIHEVAMSDAAGTAEIGIYSAGAGTNSLHFRSDARAAETVVEVPLATLDDFARQNGLERVHLVKCDAEGHDARVLSGAAGLLTDGRVDVFQFEYNHRWVFGRAFLKDVFDRIEGLPYNLARVQETGLTVFDAWHPELERFFQSNYALVHDRALPWFRLRRGAFDRANTYA